MTPQKISKLNNKTLNLQLQQKNYEAARRRKCVIDYKKLRLLKTTHFERKQQNAICCCEVQLLQVTTTTDIDCNHVTLFVNLIGDAGK